MQPKIKTLLSYFIVAVISFTAAVSGIYLFYPNWLGFSQCRFHDPDDCPASCAVCSPCENCQSLTCQEISYCKKIGMYDSWLEKIRNTNKVKFGAEQIKNFYEPWFKTLDGVDSLKVEDCGDVQCLRVYAVKDSLELRSAIPSQIKGMKVEFVADEKYQGGINTAENNVCDIENCHGLVISCGPNVPSSCPDIYMHGDGCRKYAKCEVVSGRCQQVLSPEFEQCQVCVNKCLSDYEDNPEQVFDCENACWKNIN